VKVAPIDISCADVVKVAPVDISCANIVKVAPIDISCANVVKVAPVDISCACLPIVVKVASFGRLAWFGWGWRSQHVLTWEKMPWYFWAGPVLMAKGMFSKVPIIAGSVREDIGDVYTSIVPPIIAAPPIGKPCEPATCTVANFISWGRSLGVQRHRSGGAGGCVQRPAGERATLQPSRGDRLVLG
jgi:hypothetical protein